MPLSPQVQAVLEELIASGRPSSRTLPLPDGRKNFAEIIASLTASEEIERVETRTLSTAIGQVRARVYVPEGPTPRPVIVFYHGGGWVFGNLDTHDPLCRQLANRAGATVVSVDYRLAPEHPFPAGLDDCVWAAGWVHGHAAELGADPRQVVVAGDSSGGTLAAGVALRARDQQAFPIALQILLYPAVDPSMSTRSYAENADDPFLSRSEMAWYWQQYVNRGAHRRNSYAAPVYATNLGGLPPAYLVTAEYDPLRDEGEAFAAAMRRAGVSVATRRYDGMPHGFLLMSRSVDDARQGVDEIGRVVQRALHHGLPAAH